MASRCPQRLPFHGLDQPCDLALGEMLPRSIFDVRFRLGNLAGADCTVNFSLSGAAKVRCAVAAISISSGWPTVHLMNHLFVVVRVIYDAHDRANPFARPAATTPTGPWSTLCQSGSPPCAAPGEHSGNASSPAACGLTEAASRKPLSPTDPSTGACPWNDSKAHRIVRAM